MTAQQVLPNLKHIWDDEGWEDHWWPAGPPRWPGRGRRRVKI